MNTTRRNGLLAVAFAATVAAAITGATPRGETREANLDDACSHVTWPMVPAQCLQGAAEHHVRYAMAGEATGTTMAERFAAAFQ